MRKRLLAILLATISASAMAEWVQAGSTDVAVIYADQSTIRKNGSKVDMWSLMEVKQPFEIEGSLVRSMTTLFVFDCNNRKARIRSFTSYGGKMGGGALVQRFSDLPTKFEDVAPGSPEGILSKVACGKR